MPNNEFDHSSVNFGGDTFISGTGDSSFNGLTNANGDYGNGDTVDYSHAPGPINANLITGTVVKYTDATMEIIAGTDTLINIENLRGSAFNDTLTSSGFGGVLEGGPGDDTLIKTGGNNETVSYEHATAGVTVNLNFRI